MCHTAEFIQLDLNSLLTKPPFVLDLETGT